LARTSAPDGATLGLDATSAERAFGLSESHGAVVGRCQVDIDMETMQREVKVLEMRWNEEGSARPSAENHLVTATVTVVLTRSYLTILKDACPNLRPILLFIVTSSREGMSRSPRSPLCVLPPLKPE
jgi:hypothetical protein